MKRIPLSQGLFAIVDDDDFEWLSQWKWSVHTSGPKRCRKNYAGRRGGILMHRVILGLRDRHQQVDHKDGDGLNNQRENLRPSNQQQNVRNCRLYSSSKSRIKGVSIRCNKDGSIRFRPRITVKGKMRYLGTFAKPEDAVAAYREAATTHFGEFARVA